MKNLTQTLLLFLLLISSIGFSQGTLITRGYIQLYNKPQVINYISLAGPQAGQFGIPYINIPELDMMLTKIDYITV